MHLRPTPLSALRLCALAAFCAAALCTVGVGQATAAGRPVAWGCGAFSFGQCTVPDGLNGVVAISAGEGHSMALKRDGTVVSWGCAYYLQCIVPPGLSGVTAIAAGNVHSLALKSDRTVVSWGCGAPGYDFSQCVVPPGLSGVTAIAGDYAQSLALRSDGTVVAWGCGSFTNSGQCTVPVGLVGVTAIAAGSSHSLALRNDGTVVAWGCAGGGNWGQCDVPPMLSGVTAIAAGHAQSLARKNDGTIVAWGCGSLFNYGQCVPVGLSGAIAAAGGYFHSLALKGDGTVAAWGCGSGFDYGQCTIPGELSGVSGIAAGDRHSLALVELGDQTITFAPLPNRTYGDPDFTVSASASSGLPVAFAASGECVLNGTTVLLTDVGQCTIIASQPGNGNYNAAVDISHSFQIAERPVPPASPRPQVRCVVPKVVGLKLARARGRIRARHCSVGRIRRVRSKRIGRVLAQSPKPGRRLRKGARVSLVVGRR
jgi:Regulator of chromosome condensation (RCC1) repeat/PASTA domain